MKEVDKMEHVISRGYKVAKQYSSEVVETHETVTINGSALEASLLNRIVGEKVKIIIWLDALALEILPAEEIEPRLAVSKAMIQGLKQELSDPEEISEENLSELVGQILVAESYIVMLDEDLSRFN